MSEYLLQKILERIQFWVRNIKQRRVPVIPFCDKKQESHACQYRLAERHHDFKTDIKFRCPVHLRRFDQLFRQTSVIRPYDDQIIGGYQPWQNVYPDRIIHMQIFYNQQIGRHHSSRKQHCKQYVEGKRSTEPEIWPRQRIRHYSHNQNGKRCCRYGKNNCYLIGLKNLRRIIEYHFISFQREHMRNQGIAISDQRGFIGEGNGDC